MVEATLFDFENSSVPRVALADMRELVEKSREPCPHCSQLSALNPHRICKQKVDLLALLAEGLRHGDGWCRVEAGRGLRYEGGGWAHAPYRADQHAARLDWYGLAERRGYREGLFRATNDGLRFLRGEVAVPSCILCRAGKVQVESKERVYVGQVKGVVLKKAYWDAYPRLESFTQEKTDE